MTKETVHDHSVNHEDDSKEGIRYLRDYLNFSESQAFFDQARIHREANFRDNFGHHYTLSYENGEYTLLKK